MEEGQNPAQTTAGITSRPDLAMPYLTDAMVDRLHEYGSEETAPAETKLFVRGDRDVDFFVVLNGKVEIIAQNQGEQDRLLVEVVNKQFTGELDLLNSNPVLSDAFVPLITRLFRIRRSVRCPLSIFRMAACSTHPRRRSLRANSGLVLCPMPV